MTRYSDGHCQKCGSTLTVKPCLNCAERDKLLGNREVSDS